MEEPWLTASLLVVCFYNPSGRRHEEEPQPIPQARTKYQTLWEVVGAFFTALYLLLSIANLFVPSYWLQDTLPYIATHKIHIYILSGIACMLAILMCIPELRASLRQRALLATSYIIRHVSR